MNNAYDLGNISVSGIARESISGYNYVLILLKPIVTSFHKGEFIT